MYSEYYQNYRYVANYTTVDLDLTSYYSRLAHRILAFDVILRSTE